MSKLWGRLLISSLLCLMIQAAMVLAADRQPTPAEKLTAFAPEGTLGFVATNGGDELKKSFEQSSIGKVWAEPSVQEFYQKIKDAIPTSFMDTDEDKANLDTFLNFAKTVLKRPMMICVVQKPGEKPTQSPISIHGFLLVDAGDRKAEIEAANEKLAAIDSKDEVRSVVTIGGVKVNKAVEKDEPVTMWGWVGNYFVLSLNDEKGEIFERLAKGNEIKTNPSALWNKIPATDDIVIKYVDFEKISKLVTSIRSDEIKDPKFDTVKNVLTVLGLSDVQAASARAGFAGADIVSDGIVKIAEPRTGIFPCFKPVDMAELDIVPAGVIQTCVCRIDFAKLYDTILMAVKIASAETYTQATEVISKKEKELGFEIHAALESLEGTVLTYTAPGVGFGLSPAQSVYIVKLKDPKAMETIIASLEKFAEKQNGQFEVTKQEIDGRMFHFAMIPQTAMLGVTPTWLVEKDRLIIGTNMQAVNSALSMIATTTQPTTQVVKLKDTEKFKQATKGMPKELIGFLYEDHEQNTRLSMQAMSQMWPMMTMAMQKESKFKLPMTLPPGDAIAKHLGIEVSYSWFDQDGLWIHGKGPMGSSSMYSVSGVALGVAIMLPAFERAREMAKRSMSASNLKQIYTALILYSQDYEGKFPDDLEVLVKKDFVSKELFDSPLRPAGFEGPSYIYVQGLDADTDPRFVVLYENPAYSCDGLNIAYGDGHVAWVKPDEFMNALKMTYEKLGKPMPKIEFKGEKSKSWLNWGPTSRKSEIEKERKIPFKCTTKDCGETVLYSISEFQKMTKSEAGPMPMLGPTVFDCPKCKKHTLTQAVECPKCGEIFVMNMDPQTGVFDDKCPKCGESYAKAWQEKYQKEHPKK